MIDTEILRAIRDGKSTMICCWTIEKAMQQIDEVRRTFAAIGIEPSQGTSLRVKYPNGGSCEACIPKIDPSKSERMDMVIWDEAGSEQ